MKSPSYLRILSRQVPGGAVVLRPQPAILQRWHGATQPAWIPAAEPNKRIGGRGEQPTESPMDDPESGIRPAPGTPPAAESAEPLHEDLPLAAAVKDPRALSPAIHESTPDLIRRGTDAPSELPATARFAAAEARQHKGPNASPIPASAAPPDAPAARAAAETAMTVPSLPTEPERRTESTHPRRPEPATLAAAARLPLPESLPLPAPVAAPQAESRPGGGIHIGRLEIEVVPPAPAPPPPARVQPVSFAKPGPLSRGAAHWLWNQR